MTRNRLQNLSPLVLAFFLASFSTASLFGKPGQRRENDSYRQIRRPIQARDYSRAEVQLLERLERKPDSGEAHFLLGIVYTQKGEHQKARSFFLKALKLNPDSVPVLNNLGSNALYRGDDREAKHYFRRVLELDPNDTNALYNLGLVELKRGQMDLAVGHLKKAASLRSRDPEILKALVAAQLESGAYTEANRTVRQLINFAPAKSAFYLQLARPLMDKGLSSAALNVLERARSKWPQSVQVAYNLARAYSLSGRPDAARRLAEATLKKQNRPELHNLLGDIDERLHLYDKAVEEYQTAIRLEPDNEAYYFDLGYEFLAHYNFNLASQIFERAIARLPGRPRLYLGLAAAYFGQTRYEEAIAALKAATELAPESPVGYFFLGKAFVLLSNHRDLFAGQWVSERFKRYMELRPNDPVPYYVNAVDLLRRTPATDAARDEALKLLEKAVELDPNFPEAYVELGRIYFDRKRFPPAIAAYERAVQLNPALSEAYYGLSQAYARSGNIEKARETSTLAVRRQKELESHLAAREKEVLRFIYTLK